MSTEASEELVETVAFYEKRRDGLGSAFAIWPFNWTPFKTAVN